MIQWGIYSHVRLKIHWEYEGSVHAEVLTTRCRVRKPTRALEMHAYNVMTNNSLPSMSHYSHTSQHLFPTDHLTQPPPQLPQHSSGAERPVGLEQHLSW